MTLRRDDPTVSFPHFDPCEVYYEGWRIIDWFHKELVTTHREAEREGCLEIWVKFDVPMTFTIERVKVKVTRISFRALRVRELKTKWVEVHGDALYDFAQRKMVLPPGKGLTTSAFSSDFSDWEDYEGQIPDSEGFLDWRLKVFVCHFDPAAEVLDLSEL